MPILEIPEEKLVEKKIPRSSFGRRVFVGGLRLLVVLALGTLGAGGWYLAKKGFGRQWRARLAEELHKHGVEASIGRLTLDPFRGLVAQDVRVFDYKKRENTIAQISRISLDINYAALLQHQPFLNAIDVHNAQVALPLPAGADPKSPHVQIKNLRAHIYFPPEQIYVSQAEGFFAGIRISATGQLIKRNDYKPSNAVTEEEWQERLQLLHRVATELNKFKFSGRPQLQLKFSGDVAQLENARIEGTLRAEQFQRGNYRMRQLVIAGEFVDQALSINQCQWQDDAGLFSGNGVWRRPSGELEFQARSSLNLSALCDAFGLAGVLSEVKFNSAPRLDLLGHARLNQSSPQWQATGHVACDAFSYKTIPFAGASAEFSWDGARTMLRDIRLRHSSGEITAQWLEAPGDFRLDLNSAIDLNVLRPLAPAKLRAFINEWDWPRASRVQLTIRGTSRDPVTWKGDGKLQVDRGRFRKIGFNSGSADVHFGDGAVTYENFRVARDEGVATGAFTYDFAHHETRFTNVRSTLRPAEAIYWIDPRLLKTVTPYKFRKPPTIVANGIYQFGGGKNTHFEINVDSAAGMDYVFLGKTLPFDRIAGKLLFTDDRLQITELTSAIFSGALKGTADVSLAHGNQNYRASVAVEGIDFPRLTDLYFKFKTAEGSMNGHYEWNGLGAEARSMIGKGEVEVRNGDVFAIPLFGPLSDLLDKVLPGLGHRVAHKASMTFNLNDGVIRTSDFRVDAGTFGMVGHGDSHFLDDKIDFDLRINASGPGFVLTPLYKFFEYKAEGSLSHPTWRPKNF